MRRANRDEWTRKMNENDEPVVLLVDDESHVLSALRRGLRREAIQVETARNAREALGWLASHSADLVISDQKMPGMSGVDLLKTIRARWPDIERILLSGWTSEISKAALDEAGLFCVIAKPWDDAELRRSIREAVGLG
jgi:DNA-binding NtrC family response regulator